MAQVKEFSVEEKLSALVTLQKIESKLDEIHILKGELPMEVADLEDEIQGLHSRQTRIEEEINGITEFIEQKKEAIKEAQALIKKYEKQTDNVKNNREFEAINKEIEMQQLEVKLCEKHIKDANEEIAEKAVSLEKAKKAIAAKEGVLNTKKESWKRSLQLQKKKKGISIKWYLKQESMLMIAYSPVMIKFAKAIATALLLFR
jgi:predicted  nucleic acid-binding Zn-ribbon protein